MKFFIPTASTGNGHISASDALVEEFKSRGHESEWLDCMDNVSKRFRRWFKGGYETLVRESPWLWGHLYRTSDRPLFNYAVQTFLDYKCSWPIDQIIRDYAPDWVVCTHSVIQPRLPALRRELGFKVAVIVTDLYPHRMWLRGSPDYFFVATEQSLEALHKRVPETRGRAWVTGIPVNEVFASAPSRSEARSGLGIGEEEFVVLISSGGIGAGPFDQVAQMVAQLPLRLIVVAGRHAENRQRLEKLFSGMDNVRVEGQVTQPEMAQRMAAADLLIGKSGGLTTFEALAVGLPFLVYKPFLIPGQEEDNADFLEKVGAGRFVTKIDDLEAQVKALMADPGTLTKMREAAKRHAKPHAKRDIVDKILELSLVSGPLLPREKG